MRSRPSRSVVVVTAILATAACDVATQVEAGDRSTSAAVASSRAIETPGEVEEMTRLHSAMVEALEQAPCGDEVTEEPIDYGLPGSVLPAGRLPDGYHASAESAVAARLQSELSTGSSGRSTLNLGYELAGSLQDQDARPVSDEESQALYSASVRSSILELRNAIVAGNAEVTTNGPLLDGVNERARLTYRADVGAADGAVSMSAVGVMVDGREVWTVDTTTYPLHSGACSVGEEEDALDGDEDPPTAPTERVG